MIHYPKDLRSLLSESYEIDSKMGMLGGDGSDIYAYRGEFLLRSGRNCKKEYDSFGLEAENMRVSRFHTNAFSKGDNNYISLLEMALPSFVDRFSDGDDTQLLDEYITPLALGFSSSVFDEFMKEQGKPKMFDEEGFIAYYKHKGIFLHKMYLVGGTPGKNPLTVPGVEYIIPDAVMFPDGTSVCWHMYTESTKKGDMLNVVEHVVYGSKKRNQIWSTLRDMLLAVATGSSIPDIPHGVKKESSCSDSTRYVYAMTVPDGDKTWRPDV